jgi:hypothetical protein
MRGVTVKQDSFALFSPSMQLPSENYMTLALLLIQPLLL